MAADRLLLSGPFPAVFSGIGQQRMKTFFPSLLDEGSLDLLATFVSRREIRD